MKDSDLLFTIFFLTAGESFKVLFIYLLKKDFIYLFTRDTEREREAEAQAEGEAGSMQGARCGTRSRDLRIMPWAEGRH